MTVKDKRLAIRLTHRQHELIREAADLEGRTISDFATTALTEHANDVLAEQRVFRLTGARWDELMAMLDSPPVVRPALVEILRKHAKLVKP